LARANRLRPALRFALLVAAAALISSPVQASVSPVPPVDGTRYQNEGTPADGYPSIDASGRGPAGDISDNWTNWTYQYGSASWSAVYGAEDGWVQVASSGEMKLQIEADIEAYAAGSFSAGMSGQGWTGRVSGNLVSNGGQYVGLALAAGSPSAPARLRAASQRSTLYRRGSLNVALSTDAGPWRWPQLTCPSPAGEGEEDAAWWLVERGSAGSFVLEWGLFNEESEERGPPAPAFAPTVIVASVL